MDEAKIQEARQLLEQVSLELAQASEAAHKAATADSAEAWKQAQLLFTRFDAAAQLLRDLRRAVDAAVQQP